MSPFRRFICALGVSLAVQVMSLAPMRAAPADPVATAPDTTNTGTIHGQVLVNGKPGAFANLIVLGMRRGAQSDEKGQFRITRIPAGTWTLRTMALGYDPASTIITIQAGRDTTVQVAFAGTAGLIRILDSPQRRMRQHPVPDCDSTAGAEGSVSAEPDTSGWWTASGSIFDFALPPEFRRKWVMGIDSEVGEWDADSSRITYDLGEYTGCAQPGRPEPGVIEECWHGYRARIRLASEPNHANVEACFPAFGLGLYGSSPDPAERTRILAAFRTIRFRERTAPTRLSGPPVPLLPRPR